MCRFDAAIFDLDGVLTDTAEAHYQAWLRLAHEECIPFDRTINERLKGISRSESLDIILEQAPLAYDERAKDDLKARKNGYYRELIQSVTPDELLPGALQAIRDCRAAGLRVALASSSRNAPALIARLGIARCFDFVADPAGVARSKPAPDIFLAAAAGVETPPERCFAIEDAVAGIKAIKAAGMYAIGIGDPGSLSLADEVIADLSQFDLPRLLNSESMI